MDSSSIQNIISIGVYIAAILAIGVYTARRAGASSENYFIGGRGLGPWIAAMSAEASDMSGWLLMGLPGVAYWLGLSDAFWTAIGLAIGTYINWLLVSKRLRRYSVKAGNAITIPDFFSNRFKEKKPVLLLISSVIILIFFSVYVGSTFVAGGKLFSILFQADYHLMLVMSAIFVVLYTFLGGFWAESISDLIQAVIMIISLLAVLVFGVISAGGLGAIFSNISDIPGFVDFFGIANPTVEGGRQVIQAGAPVFGEAGAYGFITILSTMSWGLGYFGMPQVLLRFIAIRDVNELDRSRRIAIVWCVISLAAAVLIGLIGRAIFPSQLATAAEAENIFILLSRSLFHPLFAGIVMAGILAASMSSSDSYLLIASSAVSKNIFQNILKKTASDKQVMLVSRITLCIIAIFGLIIAWDENSVIFTVVSFAWAGFGAAFGPLMLFSLFWKRTTAQGAVAGIAGGGLMVFVWKLLVRPLGGAFNIYELLPAFIFACLCIVVVSLLTPKPSKEIQDEFEYVKMS
jgi:sodium/proline symporter